MSHYKPYPAYKDSGVEWLGRVPEHWEVSRLATVFEERRTKVSDKDYPALSVTKQGILPQLESVAKTDDGDNRRLVCKGDIAINSRSDRKGSSGLVDRDGSVSLIITVLKPSVQIQGEFAHHLIRSEVFQEEFYRVGNGLVADLWTTNYSSMREIKIALLPVEEQKGISDFLDRETTRIDALIAKKTRFIELLKEKRQALITQAVTKGLDPNVKMKDSGVEWLGEVPEHWVVMQLQYLIAKIEQGWSPECLGEPAQGTEWGVVKSGCVNGGVFSPAENKKLPDGFKPRLDISIRTGDILMSRASGSVELIGSIGLVDEFEGNLMLSDKIFRINLNSNIHKLFFMIVMTSRLIRNQIETAISGAEGLANNLPQARIRKFWFALPPQEEQTLISDHVKAQTKRLEALMAKSDRSITLLKERRSALITAAVTGQIDLREAA